MSEPYLDQLYKQKYLKYKKKYLELRRLEQEQEGGGMFDNFVCIFTTQALGSDPKILEALQKDGLTWEELKKHFSGNAYSIDENSNIFKLMLMENTTSLLEDHKSILNPYVSKDNELNNAGQIVVKDIFLPFVNRDINHGKNPTSVPKFNYILIIKRPSTIKAKVSSMMKTIQNFFKKSSNDTNDSTHKYKLHSNQLITV